MTGVYALKEACINDTIVRTDCKYKRLHSCWNKTKPGLDGVRVTFLKINFGLGPNAPQTGPDEILKFLLMQTSNTHPQFQLIQSDRKVTQPILDTCSIYQKINSVQIRKQKKNSVIISVGNVHRVQRCIHSLFSSCLMQPGEEFLQWPETVHQTKYFRFVWHRRIRKSKLILAS
jgi:hypothetical protein